MFAKYSLAIIAIAFNVLCVLSAPANDFVDVTALPDGIKPCKEDENINTCIRDVMQSMIKRSKDGVPELNIRPTDPLIQEKSNLQFENNFVQGKMALRNVRIVGLSKSTVDKTEFERNGDKVKFTTYTRTPKLQVDGSYKAEVFVNNNKMSSKGIFNVTITDISAKTETEAELYERDGHSYMRITKFNIDPTLGDMHVYATGLVPDKALNDALLDLANQNWRQVYKSVVPETRSTWEPIFLKNANEFFAHLPFDLLLINKQ
uniref:Hemolymph juvenile hormone binding protein (JHBP) n=1 Tax=Musca domestica TaxID=7370 RepID=T1PH85_MUSDO